jgi:hypothetical protein
MTARSSSVSARLHLVGDGAVEPVGQVVGSGSPDEAGKLLYGVDGDGEAGEHHPASLRWAYSGPKWITSAIRAPAAYVSGLSDPAERRCRAVTSHFGAAGAFGARASVARSPRSRSE